MTYPVYLHARCIAVFRDDALLWFFTKIFNIISWRLIKPDSMQASKAGYRWHMFIEDSPDLHNQVLSAGQFASHKVNVNVQVPVVEFFDDLAADQRAQFFEINYEPRKRIGSTPDGYD